MINLLPRVARAKARREYLRRLIGVATCMAAAVCAVCTGLLVPLTITLRQERASALAYMQQIQQTLADPTLTASAADAATAAALLGAVSQESKASRPSAIFNLLLAVRPKGVSVQQMSFMVGAASSTALDLGGVANTRENLLAFKTALLSIPGVKSAEFPPGDLAASSTVSFSMHVVYTGSGSAPVAPLSTSTNPFGSEGTSTSH